MSAPWKTAVETAADAARLTLSEQQVRRSAETERQLGMLAGLKADHAVVSEAKALEATLDRSFEAKVAQLAKLLVPALPVPQAPAQAPQSRGRKPEGARRDGEIREKIDQMLTDDEIKYPAQGARLLLKDFPDYQLDTLARKVSNALKAQKPKKRINPERNYPQ
jgi:hypothetical protein